MKNARFELRIPSATKERWELEARERGLTLTELVMRSVERLLSSSGQAKSR
jgi:hypothetical protein